MLLTEVLALRNYAGELPPWPVAGSGAGSEPSTPSAWQRGRLLARNGCAHSPAAISACRARPASRNLPARPGHRPVPEPGTGRVGATGQRRNHLNPVTLSPHSCQTAQRCHEMGPRTATSSSPRCLTSVGTADAASRQRFSRGGTHCVCNNNVVSMCDCKPALAGDEYPAFPLRAGALERCQSPMPSVPLLYLLRP